MAASNRGLNSDPLRNFRYRVAINHPNSSLKNLARFGFMAVSGLSVNNEVIPYREGGNNTTTRKMPGQSDFGPLTMTRGFMAAPIENGVTSNIGTHEIYDWFTQIFSVAIGAGFGNNTDFRVGVTIDVLEHPMTSGAMAAGVDQTPPIKARFAVYNAWPMGYSFSDLEAGGNAVFIENLTLAHEGWAVITASQDPGSFVGGSQMP
jgi:phage tail-like protein